MSDTDLIGLVESLQTESLQKKLGGIITILCNDVKDFEAVEKILTERNSKFLMYNPRAPHYHEPKKLSDFLESLSKCKISSERKGRKEDIYLNLSYCVPPV